MTGEISGHFFEDKGVHLKMVKNIEKPDIEEFKVRVSGTGMNTEYTVIAL